MDGVLSNFQKKYSSIDAPDNHKKFRDAVLNQEIFLHLEKMPNADKLLAAIAELEAQKKVKVEILTSTGSKDPDMIKAGQSQKTAWLRAHGIPYKPNFVTNFSQKEEWAKPFSILIDDREDCAFPFSKHMHSVGILHNDEYIDVTIKCMNTFVDTLLNVKNIPEPPIRTVKLR